MYFTYLKYILYIYPQIIYFLKGDAYPFQAKLSCFTMGVRMQANISRTHPPCRIKVGFGQGFVIIGIRIRKGPLSHDAGSEPAEQGKKRI